MVKAGCSGPRGAGAAESAVDRSVRDGRGCADGAPGPSVMGLRSGAGVDADVATVGRSGGDVSAAVWARGVRIVARRGAADRGADAEGGARSARLAIGAEAAFAARGGSAAAAARGRARVGAHARAGTAAVPGSAALQRLAVARPRRYWDVRAVWASVSAGAEADACLVRRLCRVVGARLAAGVGRVVGRAPACGSSGRDATDAAIAAGAGGTRARGGQQWRGAADSATGQLGASAVGVLDA